MGKTDFVTHTYLDPSLVPRALHNLGTASYSDSLFSSNVRTLTIHLSLVAPFQSRDFNFPFSDYQVKFHFITKKSNGKVLDDSRKDGVPMELVLGKKFKLEVWEVIVQKMSLNEVSRFIVDKSLVPQYPFISKTLRDARKPPGERKHCCGMTIQNEGIGYEDLNELFTSPCDLEFIIGSMKWFF